MQTDCTPTRDDLTPNESDFLISLSTVPGYEAYRDAQKGSPYVIILSELIKKHGSE
jgi:hypothetical protein